MTREEAIDLLDNLIGFVEDNHGSDYDEALKLAIKALEEEPCEDAISRQAVLKPYQTLKDDDTICIWLLRKNIEQQPPVTPKHKPCISRQTLKDIDRAFKALEERDELLDKIRAEIKQKARPNELGGRGNGKSIRYGLCMALEIIDKYKTESEET